MPPKTVRKQSRLLLKSESDLLLQGGDVASAMKSFSCLATLPLLLSAKIYGASNLLPGVTYYDGHPNLAGRLVFLLSRDVNLDTNSTTSAAIYQIDLSRNQLAKVTDSPKGTFHVSDVGDIFWVVFRSGAWHKGVGTNVFVYSKSTNKT